MTGNDFVQFRKDFDEQCTAVLVAKGPDYCRTADRLENFKAVAEVLGVDPVKVWAVYFMKHVAAIGKYVRDGKTASETIQSRFLDARNYLDLGLALIQEGMVTKRP